MKMGRDIGKISAVAGSCDGFAANRSRAPFVTEMFLMLEEGALPEQVDKVMIDFGYPMGPFAVSDLSGSTSATTRASAAPRPIRTTASCTCPTASSRWAARDRRPAPAGIATRKATARRIRTKW
jgi:3-hydroxyacyl-CoA dehydrogenase